LSVCVKARWRAINQLDNELVVTLVRARLYTGCGGANLPEGAQEKARSASMKTASN
jgi:hypothetical protein